jgi:hypothetical protein
MSMSSVNGTTWLPWLLLRLTLGIAVALLGLVLAAPALDQGGDRLLALFAHDMTVRRTAIASAVGLVATACIFFRPPRVAAPDVKPGRRPRRSPQPPSGAGA